ncbi:MAG: hypothetical protein A3D96_01760 [Chlamydiae bacterium RIFCSPHIGHO2_12_FULL_44_59]|nr:MAG: hypothetical protein A3C42_04785 [Chlamydiae bacterium RIFCSPHIGHO2_02_FULL_45_9]OGN60893.1 MAG: hypothetical protein A3D96_01760 [Chlamydiae bacterium RIFCSPHIGHO2_12_FULL_44_59]OGN71013.1 MAG: hypothetical protein A3F79_05445 [Chlamydiae bacterium RIFCSPLOWO2_12_FULL_45_20]
MFSNELSLFKKKQLMYGEIMEGKKSLALATFATIFFVFFLASAIHFAQPQRRLQLQSHFLSFGNANAPVEVVLIEDFQCTNCRIFSKKLIPQLQKGFIDSGQVRLMIVPVAFLRGSQMVGNAACEIYRQNTQNFFPYLYSILEMEGEPKPADLLRFARRLRGIDLDKLQECIDRGCHSEELHKNLDWAQQFMGAQFRTPALYVNGDAGSTYSFEAVKHQIELILGGP